MPINEKDLWKEKKFLGLRWWSPQFEDRGSLGIFEGEDGEARILIHKFCNTVLHIGIYQGIPFRYCPKCRTVTMVYDK